MNQKAVEHEKERERESQRERNNREELVGRIARMLPETGQMEPVKGVRLARSTKTGEPVYGVSDATFCITAQGRKEVFLGGQRYQYDPYKYLLSTAELPIVSRVLAASEDLPYIGIYIVIDPAVVSSVMLEMGQLPPRSQVPTRAIEVSPLDDSLLDAVVRLARLLDSPDEARLLLPLVSREITFRLLSGEQGHRLRQMTVLGGHTHRISQAVEKISREFNKQLHVEELARESA